MVRNQRIHMGANPTAACTRRDRLLGPDTRAGTRAGTPVRPTALLESPSLKRGAIV